MNENAPGLAPLGGVDDDARVAAVSRLHDLISGGGLSLERFSGTLDQVFAAASHAELEAAMLALPSLVRLTPASQRLARPLVLHVPDSALELGSGWQLAADTAIGTGFGAARLDLTAASWDVDQINLHLQTWGSIEVLVPKGVAVQMLGGSAKRPARVAVSARPRRSGVADFDIRTNRGDPDTPPQGAQRPAVHALEATAPQASPVARGNIAARVRNTKAWKGPLEKWLY